MPSLTSNLVNPRQRREKGKKRETVSFALSASCYLATDTLGEISFLPLFPFLFPCSTPSTTLLGYRDRWWVSRERGILCESRKPRNLQPHYLSLCLSFSWPRSKLLTFCPLLDLLLALYRGRVARQERNVNRIRGLLFPVPRKIHFPSEEGSAPRQPTLEIFSFRFTRVPLAVDTAKRRRLIASINDDTFYREAFRLPLPSQCDTREHRSWICSRVYGVEVIQDRGSGEFYVLRF